VVKCVVNVVRKLHLCGRYEFATFLDFIFVHSRNGTLADAEKQISPLRCSQKREQLRSK
jgi:hypothetical protein